MCGKSAECGGSGNGRSAVRSSSSTNATVESEQPTSHLNFAISELVNLNNLLPVIFFLLFVLCHHKHWRSNKNDSGSDKNDSGLFCLFISLLIFKLIIYNFFIGEYGAKLRS